MKKKPAKTPKPRKATLPVVGTDAETGKPFEATSRKAPPAGLSTSELQRWLRENNR